MLAKQRPFTGERDEAASNQFDRWIDALRMRPSHPGNPVRNAFELDVKSVHKVPWVYRTCLNPRLLNPYLYREKATLPTVAEIRQAVKGATRYSVLDLRDAFMSIRLATDEDCALTCVWLYWRGEHGSVGVYHVAIRPQYCQC